MTGFEQILHAAREAEAFVHRLDPGLARVLYVLIEDFELDPLSEMSASLSAEMFSVASQSAKMRGLR